MRMTFDKKWLTILALVLGLALCGVATTIAEEAAEATPAEATQPAEAQQPADDQATTTTLEGLTVIRDAESGALRAPTAAELKTLAPGGFLKRTSTGLRGEERPDGTLVLNLHGAFLSASVAKVEADGDIATGCVESPSGYDAFYNASEEEASDER